MECHLKNELNYDIQSCSNTFDYIYNDNYIYYICSNGVNKYDLRKSDIKSGELLYLITSDSDDNIQGPFKLLEYDNKLYLGHDHYIQIYCIKTNEILYLTSHDINCEESCKIEQIEVLDDKIYIWYTLENGNKKSYFIDII